MVERFVRIEEVVVSITISSTKNPPDSTPEGFSFLRIVDIPPFCDNRPLCTEVRSGAP